MKQIILAVDDSGNFLEYIPKETGHQGEGKRHLAITVLLQNSQNQVLLQKRKHKIFDNVWDFTGATHPLHKQSLSLCGKADGQDETLGEATQRCLQVEYGIKDKISLKNLGFFNYFAKDGEYCENEHCAMMVGEYEGKVDLNPQVGYEYRWVDKSKFFQDIRVNPQNYAPWVIEGVMVLKQAKFL